jgi:putative protein-disulfide isomerase
MNTLRLHYFFDPLCGWCYASAPAIAGLALAFPDSLEFMPSGLFADEGARELSADWADYAWRNDQRIEQLTGQRFTSAYREQVLGGAGVRFDSGPANHALTALRELDADLEWRYLQAIQLARYVDGRDTARPAVLGAIAARVAAECGIAVDAAEFAERLRGDGALRQATARRVGATRDAMRRLGRSGVPQLLVGVAGQQHVLSGEALHGGLPALVATIQRLGQAAMQPS